MLDLRMSATVSLNRLFEILRGGHAALEDDTL